MSISIYIAYLYNLNTMLYIYGLYIYIYTCFKDITAFPCAKLLIVPKDTTKTWLSNIVDKIKDLNESRNQDIFNKTSSQRIEMYPYSTSTLNFRSRFSQR